MYVYTECSACVLCGVCVLYRCVCMCTQSVVHVCCVWCVCVGVGCVCVYVVHSVVCV